MIKMAFFGSYKTDIINYFSRILMALDKRVAIVDASNDGFLYHSIPQVADEIVNYRDVDVYITMEGFHGAATADYDVILIDYGFNLDKAFLTSDVKLLVTDFQKHNIFKLKNLLSNIPEGLQLVKIFRDLVESKINHRYIDNYLRLTEIAEVVMEYDLWLDEDAYKCNIQCQYDDIFNFKRLPKEYKAMFKDILIQFFSLENKAVVKAIKQAEGGK